MNDTQPALTLPAKFVAGACGLEISGKATEQQWLKAGQCLANVDKALPWLIGDWILAGEQQWGKTYEEAEQITGLAYQTIANAASVCRRVESYRRREKLKFDHHAAVASLEPDDQAELLEAAERGNWNTETMRNQVRAAKGLPTPDMELSEDEEKDDDFDEEEKDDDKDWREERREDNGAWNDFDELDEDEGEFDETDKKEKQQNPKTKSTKPPPDYPLSVAFRKAITDIVAALNLIRVDHGSVTDMFKSSKWDPKDTSHVVQQINALAKTLNDMKKELNGRTH